MLVRCGGSPTTRRSRGSEDQLVGEVERRGLGAVDVGDAVVASEVADAVAAAGAAVDIGVAGEGGDAAAGVLG